MSKPKSHDDYHWVEERRAGNRRIVWYLVAFCAVIMLFSGWSFIRFMEQRTGHSRDAYLAQQADGEVS